MPKDELQTYTFWVLRYTPNLVRDEWFNIGILLHDPARHRLQARLIEEPRELARLRKFHPMADLNLVRALKSELESQAARHAGGPSKFIAQLEQTLSNVLQLSPQRGALAQNADEELDRLYRDYVEPPRYRVRPTDWETTRAGIRAQMAQTFRRARVLEHMERSVPVDEFTEPGDPFRMDFAYARNGTRGFLHALALAQDPAQAKVLAYTVERIRARLAGSEFAAITEVEPRPDNLRHQFVARLLAEQQVAVLPLARLEDFASQLRPGLS